MIWELLLVTPLRTTDKFSTWIPNPYRTSDRNRWFKFFAIWPFDPPTFGTPRWVSNSDWADLQDSCEEVYQPDQLQPLLMWPKSAEKWREILLSSTRGLFAPSLDHNIILSCKDIYNEARPLIFARNTFAFTLWKDTKWDDMGLWNLRLQQLITASKAANIQKVEVIGYSWAVPEERRHLELFLRSLSRTFSQLTNLRVITHNSKCSSCHGSWKPGAGCHQCEPRHGQTIRIFGEVPSLFPKLTGLNIVGFSEWYYDTFLKEIVDVIEVRGKDRRRK